jgi:hypothetical protein
MSRSLEARRAAILDEIASLGPAMPGSLVVRHNRCARPDCRCHGDPPQLHGPYPAWTRKVDGKTVTRSLSAQQLERYQPWFDNARRLRELVDQLRQLAIEQAQREGDWPHS